ncbi:hypothetical protein JYT93_00495 [bacterium AH-315-J19]|nr:hypothetical protein [Robiginitomaculum sp.]MBN4058493.1 hypothetical protein [bacterium AH-315-J19]
MKIEAVGSGIPKKARIKSQTAERGEVCLKGHVNGLKIGAGIVGGLIFPIILAVMTGGGFIIWLVTVIAWIFLIKRIATSKLDLVVTPDIITIDGKNYDRKLWGGFRAGVVTTQTQTSQKGQSAQVIQGEVVFQYGGVEEKTRVMVDHILHERTVNWLNDFVAKVPTSNKPAPSPETGDRKQAF